VITNLENIFIKTNVLTQFWVKYGQTQTFGLKMPFKNEPQWVCPYLTQNWVETTQHFLECNVTHTSYLHHMDYLFTKTVKVYVKLFVCNLLNIHKLSCTVTTSASVNPLVKTSSEN